jgi:hypothetical protein
MNLCSTYTHNVLSCRSQKVAWLCLAVVLVLTVMPFLTGSLSAVQTEWLGLDDAAVEELPDLLTAVVRCTLQPGSSLLRSLHLPDLSFHPPA